MKRKNICGIISAFLCIIMLSGCANFNDLFALSDEGQNQDDEIVSLGLTPEFNYDIPESLPEIVIDQVGYSSDSNKIAVFMGENLPDTYDLIDAVTGETVYTGKIEQKGYNDAAKENFSYGDFTDYRNPGTYYLQAEVIGRSYPFVIADEPYDSILKDSLKQYYYSRCGLTLSTEFAGEAAHNACHTRTARFKEDAGEQIDVSGGWHIDENGTRDVAECCHAVNNLLLSYELYGEVFTDDVGIPESGNGIPDIIDEVRYEIDWLLKMQDGKSGAVYSAVSVMNNSSPSYQLYIEPVTMDATIHFAATLAKFSYLYQDYDLDFATQCLKAADRAYRYVGEYPDDVLPEDYFYAATELYRATGNKAYRKAVHNFLEDGKEPDMNNNDVFWGCVTYLSTKQSVDSKLCSKAITALMRDVEKISYGSKASQFLTEGNEEQDNNDELLQKMTRLAVVDHIITNHEYTTVLENHLHYFLGRNAQSISYIDGAGSRNYQTLDEKMGIMKQVDLNAEFILMLSAIQAN